MMTWVEVRHAKDATRLLGWFQMPVEEMVPGRPLRFTLLLDRSPILTRAPTIDEAAQVKHRVVEFLVETYNPGPDCQPYLCMSVDEEMDTLRPLKRFRPNNVALFPENANRRAEARQRMSRRRKRQAAAAELERLRGV